MIVLKQSFIDGNVEWVVGDHQQNGEVVVNGNALPACAPSMGGGRLVVKGDVGPRSGIGMKGGELIIGGNAGDMTGFMMQKGRMIICGNSGKAIGDSMYDGVIYVGGKIEEAGSGTRIEMIPNEEYEDIKAVLNQYDIPVPSSFKKITCNKPMFYVNKEEFSLWKFIETSGIASA